MKKIYGFMQSNDITAPIEMFQTTEQEPLTEEDITRYREEWNSLVVAKNQRIDAIHFPTSPHLLKLYCQMVDEMVASTVDKSTRLPSVTIDFTFEGHRYKGIAYPVKEEQK